MKEAEPIAHISSICIRAAKGDLEARISPLPDSQGWNELTRAINGLLDMSDSYVRESQAALEYCSRHEYYRPVLVRGMRGAYRVASTVSVAAACEELTATSAEISRRLNDSAVLTDRAVSQSNKARDAAGTLTEAAGRIKDVLRLIKEIAGQTNLLAINASIEAAHAGERGKGFMVVANEVRSLSHHTATATGSIAEQVQTMASVSGNVETAISMINDSIENLNTHVASIAPSVEDQLKATREIAQQMNSVSISFSSIMRTARRPLHECAT